MAQKTCSIGYCGQPMVEGRKRCVYHQAKADELSRKMAAMPFCTHPGCKERRREENLYCGFHTKKQIEETEHDRQKRAVRVALRSCTTVAEMVDFIETYLLEDRDYGSR